MKIEQIYEKCLSQASYYIEFNGEAAVIDPLRDVSRYLALADVSGAKIKYIFETHFHADFVSGHLELEQKTGAVIIFGPEAVTGFKAHIASDGEYFGLGGASLTLLHTPGHTLESSCLLLKDVHHQQVAIFTGDTLFLGDVGRPDLAQDTNIGLSKENLAGMLYDSLHRNILPLSDHITLYPGHGAGSACGKNMSSETVDTLGNQRKSNYALNAQLSKPDFIHLLCGNLNDAPEYFPMDVRLNRQGYTSIDQIIKMVVPLNPRHFSERMSQQGTMVLDVRSADDFAAGHIPGSINIGLDGRFAPWVGEIIPSSQKQILLVCPRERIEETIMRLGRIGYHQCTAYLALGIDSWSSAGNPVENVLNISAAAFCELHQNLKGNLIDVRAASEFALGSIGDSQNIPLSKDIELKNELMEDTYIFCAGGYRSMIFISKAKAAGHQKLINISGGYNALVQAGIQS